MTIHINAAKAALLTALLEWQRKEMILSPTDEVLAWAKKIITDRPKVFVIEKDGEADACANDLILLCLNKPSKLDVVINTQ